MRASLSVKKQLLTYQSVAVTSTWWQCNINLCNRRPSYMISLCPKSPVLLISYVLTILRIYAHGVMCIYVFDFIYLVTC